MRFVLWFGSLALVLLAACPGRLADPNEFLDGGGGGDGGTGGGAGGGSGCDVENGIFLMKCGTSLGCHAGAALAADGLNLIDAGFRQKLAGTSQCNGLPYKTYMITKVQSATPPCGNQMPLGGPYLSTAEIQCLTDYMDALDGGP